MAVGFGVAAGFGVAVGFGIGFFVGVGVGFFPYSGLTASLRAFFTAFRIPLEE